MSKIEWSIIAKALWSLTDPAYIHEAHDDDGSPCLAYSGCAMSADILLTLLYEGVKSGDITFDINPEWKEFGYWNKLSDNIVKVYDRDHETTMKE